MSRVRLHHPFENPTQHIGSNRINFIGFSHTETEFLEEIFERVAPKFVGKHGP